MIEMLAGGLMPYAAAALAAVVAIAGVWLSGRKAGRDATRREAAEAAADVAKERTRADAAADRVADPGAELRRDWMR